MISTANELQALCLTLSRKEWVGIDTEFLRIRTYYPKLCLIQISSSSGVWCVDVTAFKRLDALSELINNQKVMKILHAPDQDFEVLLPRLKALPTPLFDTQAAAAFCGMGDQVSYASLVEQVTGVVLEKAHTRTDWCRRPLSDAQIGYAEDDVRYLGDIYHYLEKRLEQTGRREWAEEQFALLSRQERYFLDPELAWKRLGRGNSLSPVAQQRLKALAVWREKTAQDQNIPREWVIKDVALMAVARLESIDSSSLENINELSSGQARRWLNPIQKVISTMDVPQNEVVWPRERPMTRVQSDHCKKMMKKIRERAMTIGMSASLIATRKDVEAVVRGERGSPLVTGWRRKALGDSLTEELESLLGLSGR